MTAQEITCNNTHRLYHTPVCPITDTGTWYGIPVAQCDGQWWVLQPKDPIRLVSASFRLPGESIRCFPNRKTCFDDATPDAITESHVHFMEILYTRRPPAKRLTGFFDFLWADKTTRTLFYTLNAGDYTSTSGQELMRSLVSDAPYSLTARHILGRCAF